MKFIIILFSSFVIFFSACKKEDTCNSRLGNTFNTISLDSSNFINVDNDFQINLSIQVLDTLPNEYFEDFILIKRKNDLFGNPIQNSAEVLKGITVDKSKIEIVILQDSLPQIGAQNDLSLYLKFSDRMEYIDCIHPGSGDSYFLDLEMKMNRIFQDSIRLSEFTWKETLNKGGF